MGRLQHKRGRPSKYRNSLKGEYWKKVKEKVRLRDGFKCSEKGCNSIIRLETHHITYFINGKSIRGKELENLKWIITVCENCHQKIHNNIRHLLNPKNKFKIDANSYRNHCKN